MLVKVSSLGQDVGKTTLILNLATKLSEVGYRVLLLTDTDNYDLLNWLEQLVSKPDLLTIKTLPANLNFPTLLETYDFVLLDTKENMKNNTNDFIKLICLDFSTIDENTLNHIEHLEAHEFIVPCKVRFNEGETLKLLDRLASQVGIEKVLDGIPRCERIHDLPLVGKTIWELDNKPLQAAFSSITDYLITYL